VRWRRRRRGWRRKVAALVAEGGGGDPGEGSREDGWRFRRGEPGEVHCRVHGLEGRRREWFLVHLRCGSHG